jgi:hypothetical protein
MMMKTEVTPEMSMIFNHLTQLMSRGDIIELATVKASGLAWF